MNAHRERPRAHTWLEFATVSETNRSAWIAPAALQVPGLFGPDVPSLR